MTPIPEALKEKAQKYADDRIQYPQFGTTAIYGAFIAGYKEASLSNEWVEIKEGCEMPKDGWYLLILHGGEARFIEYIGSPRSEHFIGNYSYYIKLTPPWTPKPPSK
jgi:hypothetical protein